MKKANKKSPLVLRLNEIPQEGESFHFKRESKELNEVLGDLIGSSSYESHLHIEPKGLIYELRGSIQTEKPETCSRCANDFVLPLEGKINELLMPAQEEPRTSQYTKANHYSDLLDEGPSVTSYSDTNFDLGEFLHEILAALIPFKPLCQTCLEKADDLLEYDEPMVVDENTPFSALKDLKLN